MMSRKYVGLVALALLFTLAPRDGFAQTPPRTGPAAPSKTPAQNSSGQKPLGPQQGTAALAARPIAQPSGPQTPKWFPLPQDHQKYLDDVLNFWQASSVKIKRYECKFTRWEYDGVQPVIDPGTKERQPNVISEGEIKYESPDKGMLRVDTQRRYTVKKEGDKPQWLPNANDKGDHWICDGKSIFSFDHQNKKLIQTELPPDMQGKAIVDGPLPFMFGAEAAKIKQRFWVRVITPKDTTGEYWLEAVPKTREDASNFKSIQIIIDEKDFLPKAMQLFDLNPKTYSVYEFADRKVTDSKPGLELLDPLGLFQKAFYEPKTPSGYKKVIQRNDQPLGDKLPAENRPANPAPAATNQAKRPTGTSGAR